MNLVPYFALAVRFPTPRPQAVERFLAEEMGFTVQRRGEGWAQLENGALVLRVERAEKRSVRPLELEIVAPDLEVASAHLLAHADVTARGPIERVRVDRHELRLATALGLELVLVRELDEDETGIVPPLPVSLLWDAEAERLVQAGVRLAPLAFRADARRRATSEAEASALRDGRVGVTGRDGTCGLVDATPQFRREELRVWLLEQGYEVPAGDPT
jgi:hypothetical protein